MLGRLSILFVIFAALELVLLLLIAGAVGGVPVILWCLATGIAGLLALRLQGLRLVAAVAQGRRPELGRALSATLLAFAGVFLVIPGVLTDLAGLLLLIPSVRDRFGDAVSARFVVLRGGGKQQPVVIEGEYETRPAPDGPGVVRSPES